MAKGDTMSRMQMGIQPGLVTPAMKGLQNPASTQFKGDNPVDPSANFLTQQGLENNQARNSNVRPESTVKITGNLGGASSQTPGGLDKNTNPMFGGSVGNFLSSPRMAPMQSGSMFAQGKHPIGTNAQKMMKYGSGKY